jgi:hypothetical protein
MYREMLFALGGNIALLAAVAWLIRSLTIHFLKKDIEIYKQGLKAAYDKALIEHDTVFRSLHAKRADVIAQLYARFVELGGCLNSVDTTLREQKVKGMPPKISAEEYRRLDSCLSPCWDFFSKNKLYFSSQLSDKISTVLSNSFAVTILAVTTQDRALSSLPIEITKQLTDLDKTEVGKRISKNISEFNETIKEIENSFRTLVGIADEAMG